MRLTIGRPTGVMLVFLALFPAGLAHAQYPVGIDQSYAAARHERDPAEGRMPTPARRAAYREPEPARCTRGSGDMGAILGAIAGGLIGGTQDRHGDRPAGPPTGFDRRAARNCD